MLDQANLTEEGLTFFSWVALAAGLVGLVTSIVGASTGAAGTGTSTAVFRAFGILGAPFPFD